MTPEDSPAPAPRPPALSASEEVLEGVYAAGAVVLSTREEFMIDFMTHFPPQSRVVSRVIVTPGHMARVLQVWKGALEKFESHFGSLPELPAADKPRSQSNAGDFYRKIRIPDPQLGGVFANSMEISSRRDDFLLNFIANFPPTRRLVARVIIPASAFRRLVAVGAAAVKNHEQRHGAIPLQPPGEGLDRFFLN